MMQNIQIIIQRLPHGKGLALPSYATELSSGLDVMAAVTENLSIGPSQRHLVPSGIAMAIPQGYEMQVRARSGLALKHGITCLNAPGTIDADYRGEIGVILVNHSNKDFIVTRGMRIAQLVLARSFKATWNEVDLLDKTARGARGFGSTGLSENSDKK